MGVNGNSVSEAWNLIEIHQLTPRDSPVLSPIGPDELCILGGDDGEEDVSLGVIFNVRTQEATSINPANESQIKFWCLGESFMEMQGLVLSLVESFDNKIHLIRYSQVDNSITFLHNYGAYTQKLNFDNYEAY